jgi:hypothetical protein
MMRNEGLHHTPTQNPTDSDDIEGQIQLLRIEIRLGLTRRIAKRLNAITAMLINHEANGSASHSVRPAITQTKPQASVPQDQT